MYDELIKILSGFLEEEFLFIPRQTPLEVEIRSSLPESWLTALSPTSDLDYAVKAIWDPVKKSAENFIAVLGKLTVDFALLVFPTFPPQLVYILESTTGCPSWTAGLPATKRDFEVCEERLGFCLPSSYKLFTQVHNGFHLESWDTIGPRALHDLYTISELLGNTKHSKNLLAFSGDGAGNEQCFNMDMPVKDRNYTTIDWDHETREISHSQFFWDYIRDLISEKICL